MTGINNASAAIQWAVIRKNSAFLHKRRHVKKFFSSDKFNVTGHYTNHASGIANDAGVSVHASKDKKKTLVVELKKKSSGAAHKPASAVTVVNLTGGKRAIARKVKSLVKSYEPSLASGAYRRATKLLRPMFPRKAFNKKYRNKSSA